MKKLTKAQDIIEELKISDPLTYNEIKENTQEVQQSWGGKRSGSGRKTKTGAVLKFQVRVSQEEKEFLAYARTHQMNYRELMSN